MEELTLFLNELKKEGDLYDITVSDLRTTLTEEALDDVASLKTDVLLKEIFTPEREAIRDLYKTVIVDSMEEKNLSKSDIEIDDDDVDEIFDILFEEM